MTSAPAPAPTRIVIVSGRFAPVHPARELERARPRDRAAEITIVHRDTNGSRERVEVG